MAAIVAVACGSLAASRIPDFADAAHDGASLRALALELPDPWHALDAAVSSLTVVLPLGTRAFRASLASSLALGLAAALLFDVARQRVSDVLGDRGRLVAFASAVAAIVAALAPAAVVEATAPAGATLGLALALLPRVLAARGASSSAVALSVGLAASYEPLVGLCAAVPVIVAFRAEIAVSARRVGPMVRAVSFGLAGLVPLGIALARTREARAAIVVEPLGFPRAAPHAPAAFMVSQLGVTASLVALVGLGVALAARRGRVSAGVAIVVCALGALAIVLGAPLGPDAFSPLALVGLAEVGTLAAVGLVRIARWVGEAKVPWARPSSWLVLLLFAALPLRQADDALVRLQTRDGSPERAFVRVAFGALPLGAVVLVADPGLDRRVRAARAQGTARADVLFVSLAASRSPALLELEPRLSPLLRDQALYGAPEEWSLSALSASRPVVLTFDPRWPRPLARHLVAAGLFDRFFAEPRGVVDRKRALDAFDPLRRDLARALARSADPDIARSTASLLRARLLGAAASGDRDVAARALDDLRPFAPGDRVGLEVARRLVATRAAIDVADLGER